VSKSSPVALSDLLGSFALSALEVQQLWNKASQQASPGLFVPARLVLREWRGAIRLSVENSRRNSFRCAVEPVNLRFALTYQENCHNGSSISMEIEQVPAPGSGDIAAKNQENSNGR
jgi:hypothetical protein